MGKIVLLLVALGLVLPMLAFADSDITFTSNNGTLIGDSHGMTLTDDKLITIDGWGGSFSGTNLGNLSFSTNIMHEHSNVIEGATFFTGGSVSITGNGSNGAPNGVLFSGTFTQDPSWTRVLMPGNFYRYTFSGIATGTMFGGSTADLRITVILDKLPGAIFAGKGTINTLTATVVQVPEPNTIAFLGAGLVGLAGAIHRKYKSST